MNDLALKERLQPSGLADSADQEDRHEILEYWRAISKRRWSILGLALLVAVIAALVAYNIRPTYRGTATLLFEQGKAKLVSIEEVYSQGFAQQQYLQTQVEILKSDDLARKVAQRLNLTKHPDFDPRQAEPPFWVRYLPFREPGDAASSPPQEEAILRSVAQKVKAGLQVQLVRNSHLATISFVAHDKELAAKVPNTLAEVFIDSDLDSRMAMTEKATGWLRERMAELRTKLDAAERGLQEFRDRERIVDAKGLAQSGASRQLEQLMGSLTEARAKRAEAEAAYFLVQQIASGKTKASYESIPTVSKNPLVQRAKEVEADAERRLAEAGKRYGPEHPTMVKAKAEAETARENTRRQIESAVALIAREYEVARTTETSVERALGQSKSDIQSLNRKEFQLGVLEREVAQNRNLYDMFVNRLKETSATGGGLESTIARVIDPADVPGGAFAPNKNQIIMTATAAALLMGALLALLLDRLSNTLNSSSGVEQRLGVPALGVLQLIKGVGGAAKKKGFISELAFFNDSQSAFAESVRTVRTSVLMSALDDKHKLVVVTSSVPEEGKTTVAYNLACALGQVKKVLLIDADMRRPKIAKLIGHDSKAPGLADLVAGQAQFSQCIIPQEKAGIYVMPAGTVPPNPLELISSQRFAEMIEKIRDAFDIVIVDSAPLQLVSDSLVLSQYASGVIYVVKADATPYQVAQNGLKRLRRVGAPVMGVVLNQLDLEKAEKYYGEYSGYRSYKGYKKYGYRGYGKTYGQQQAD